MSKKILVAPLNWGLGHATRCIPIINALITNGFQPVIASDGSALSLLKKEFPNLNFIELPSYNIKYSKKGSWLKLKLLKDSPKILKAIKSENKVIQDFIYSNAIDGIISDNRFGVYSKHIPSVFLTHQLKVLSGNTTWLSSKIHHKAMLNFDECWVPDLETGTNLSGDLGHSKKVRTTTKHIGPLSRFNNYDIPIKYDLMVLLSGPEPQRSMLETKLLSELKHYKKTILFIRGIVEAHQQITVENNISIYNFMTSKEVERSIIESKLILSRSGYTTIMDLTKLQKKAFFIPTPGQYEQIYLAEKFQKEHVAPFCNQQDFNIEKLKEVKHFKGFSGVQSNIDYQELFSLF